jgi:hypothetical protein
MSVADIEPLSKGIDHFIHAIEDGEIKIPDFQRGYIWNQGQIIELLDSIYQSYPIGTFLLWNSHEKLKAPRNIGGFLLPDSRPNYPVDYVLDGQQRISTLYAVFCQGREQDPANAKYNLKPEMFDIYFDLDDEAFHHQSEINQRHKNLKINCLFDTYMFNQVVGSFTKPYAEKASRLQKQFQSYQISLVRISKKSKDQVATIFERINSTGTPLNTLDLMVAWTWSDDFHLRTKIEEITENLEQKNFGKLPERVILQCIGAVIEKTTATKNILTLNPEDVRKKFDKVKQSLDRAVDFVTTEFKMESVDFLPHLQQIVPLTYFFSKISRPDTKQLKIVKQWFWKTSFSDRYADSTDKKMDEDIAQFDEFGKEGGHFEIDKYAYNVSEEILTKQKFSKSSPLTRAFLLLMAQESPLDLVTGNRIDLGKALSVYNKKEYHHVFPRNYLKENYKGQNEINSLCNFCFLPSDSNKLISDLAPSEYFETIIPKNKKSDILNSNLLTLKNEIYTKNNYDDFLKLRAQKILHTIDEAIA